MPNHVRRQIVDAVATAVTGLTTTTTNIYTNRVHRLDEAIMPCLVVYSKNETSNRNTMGGDIFRTLSLVIEAYVKTATPDVTLDTISKEVEVAMAADRTFGGLAKDSFIASTEMDLSGEGDAPIGVMAMTYSIEYRTLNSAPTSAT